MSASHHFRDDETPPTPLPGVQPHYSINKAKRMAGKTVERVQIGFRRKIPGVHQSELIVLHFTDGTSLAIDTGSNAKNVADDSEESAIAADEFNVDFMLKWYPPPAAGFPAADAPVPAS